MIPNVSRTVELIPYTQLPIKNRRDIDMLHQEMIKRSRTNSIRQHYDCGNLFVNPQEIFNIPYRGVPLFNIRAVPAPTKKVAEYTKYQLIRLAQQYVVEGQPRKRVTTLEALTRLKLLGYKI